MIPAEGTIVADRFRLTRPLGQGGMGSVWQAQHLGLDVPCAIKFMHAHSVSDEVRVRFEREAKIAAQIRSPHVVQVLDHGVWEGAPYIAMEYLEGEDLDDRIRRVGRLDPRETLAITSQVARALTKAHAAGLVHRDLKPANIYLVRDDDREIAKVLDFGIAKDSTPRVASTTKTGSLLGTPAYMSPEQAQGTKNVDHRSDLWSLAVVVFECLTGRLPFDSEAFGDLLLKIMVKPLPVPSQFAPVPPGFDAWWARAASRDPEARFQSAKEFADGLAIALDLSLADSLDMRTSVSGLFRAPAERPSLELSVVARSHETPIFPSGPASAVPSFGEAVTLVASDTDSGRPSARSVDPTTAELQPGTATSAPRIRPQTAGALVSVVSPAPGRSGRSLARVIAAAAVGVIVAGLGGFLLLWGKSPSDSGGAAAQTETATPVQEAAPRIEMGTATPPMTAEPGATAPSATGSPEAPTASPPTEPAASGRPVQMVVPPSASGVTAPQKPRPPASSIPVRRKPKPTDFGI